jgi:MSHA biogenesis protein MshL
VNRLSDLRVEASRSLVATSRRADGGRALWVCLLAASALLGCAGNPPAVSEHHLAPPPPAPANAPDFNFAPVMPSLPQPQPKAAVYSISVRQIDVQDLLLAVARDARMNVDIHPEIQGVVTMSVHNLTVPEILARVSRQVPLRFEINGADISVMPDRPYVKSYRVDYPNIARDATSTVATTTNVASTGQGAGGSSGGGGGNGSTSAISSTANNRFWATLVSNVRELLRESGGLDGSDSGGGSRSGATASGSGGGGASGSTVAAGGATSAAAPASGGAPAAGGGRDAVAVIANPETGMITVRGNQAQHERVRDYLERVLRSARRQVLIEATIVEVDLSNRYQQGINWSLIRPDGSGSSVSMVPTGTSDGFATGGRISGLISLTLSRTNVYNGKDLSGLLTMLESFGTLRVLSSPKVSVLNNQTSLLKVVDNKVYFIIDVTPGTPASPGVPATPAVYRTTINTVPIGFLMTVVPQISDSGEVILNLRPTISRITGYANDPNPALAANNVINRIPEVQTREMESILRVQSGGVAILGGLMQDYRNNLSDEVPLANRLPVLGNLFKYRDETSKKSELVIFLRPTVVTDASLDGDYRAFRNVLSSAREGMKPPPSELGLFEDGSRPPEF